MLLVIGVMDLRAMAAVASPISPNASHPRENAWREASGVIVVVTGTMHLAKAAGFAEGRLSYPTRSQQPRLPQPRSSG